MTEHNRRGMGEAIIAERAAPVAGCAAGETLAITKGRFD
jgi:hypothetical protein